MTPEQFILTMLGISLFVIAFLFVWGVIVNIREKRAMQLVIPESAASEPAPPETKPVSPYISQFDVVDHLEPGDIVAAHNASFGHIQSTIDDINRGFTFTGKIIEHGPAWHAEQRRALELRFTNNRKARAIDAYVRTRIARGGIVSNNVRMPEHTHEVIIPVCRWHPVYQSDGSRLYAAFCCGELFFNVPESQKCPRCHRLIMVDMRTEKPIGVQS